MGILDVLSAFVLERSSVVVLLVVLAFVAGYERRHELP